MLCIFVVVREFPTLLEELYEASLEVLHHPIIPLCDGLSGLAALLGDKIMEALRLVPHIINENHRKPQTSPRWQ